MKMRWQRGKKHLDQDKLKLKEEAKRDLRTLMLCGDEKAYVALLKELKPNLTPEELKSFVLRFREERANLMGGNAL